ncbi:MAG: NAD-dependent epimerase/dehydratase family protein [Gemmataceae bacterium]|nr:NAD-dependent epimerase/dehydratase family protein [Gemmataceae bacterium]MDW8264927.1 NAD-dependent epimerase/dehydratase family protein [Gemmataceae bacterium]
MKALVTGATGFLGTALCRRLRARGDEVVALGSRDADLTRPDALVPWSDCRFERIFHLAAWTQAGDFCLHHPGEQWIINQLINTHVLAWWQKHQPQAKLIAIGSSCAYAPDRELREENYLDGVPHDSLFSYAMTKRMLYAGLLALRKQYGLTYLCLVPSTLYGLGYHADGRQMHFIYDLIRKILRGREYGEPVVLWGDGHQRRELVWLDDFVDILLELDERCVNELVNVGAGQEFSIREFANMICRLAGYDPSAIRYDSTRYVGARSKCLSTVKLRRLLPNVHLTPLEHGLVRVIRWFEDNRALLGPAPKASS